jgi:GTP-binding protein HflX
VLLLTDTVGFIQKLPHQLVMAFRATLEELLEADLLLHVVDASHPKAQEHCSAVFSVLGEIGADEHKAITVLNKRDVPESAAMIERLQHSYPLSVAVSAATGEGLADLARVMADQLLSRRERIDMVLPFNHPALSLIRKRGRVLSEEYRDDGVAIVADVDRAVAGQVRKARRSSQ